MTRPLVIDACPPRLYRAYSNPQFAEDFVQAGRIRLNPLSYFRDLEDVRQDASEGTGAYLVPGDVPRVAMNTVTGGIRDLPPQPGHFHYSISWGNPTYLFCASLPEMEPQELSDRFGPYVADIHHPYVLFSAIHASVNPEGYGGRKLSFVDCFPVRYDKGEIHERESDEWRLRISFGQKATIYSIEREYRCAVVLEGPLAGSPPHIDLTLPRPDLFCRPLW